MRQYRWLHNVDEDDVSPVYEVRNVPVRIRAYGLQPGDVVAIEALVGPAPVGTAGDNHQWVRLVRCSQPVVLTDQHNNFVEFIPGYYRVNLVGVADPDAVRITIHDDESSNDSKGMVLVESGQLCCTRTADVGVAPIPPIEPPGGLA